MSLGPPVCTKCMVVGQVDYTYRELPWKCPVCGNWDMKGSLFTYVKSMQDIIQKRTMFATSKNPNITRLRTDNVVKRPFMRPGQEEPNNYYRPWLEKNIGVQGKDWEWDLCYDDIDSLDIFFVRPESATLFELRWP